MTWRILFARPYCAVDRLSVDNDLDSPPGRHQFTARPELGAFHIPMDDDLWFDFVTLSLADWLEQVEGAAASANRLFEWEAGEAWAYRRRGRVLGRLGVVLYSVIHVSTITSPHKTPLHTPLGYFHRMRRRRG